jgi:hypothetical protein
MFNRFSAAHPTRTPPKFSARIPARIVAVALLAAAGSAIAEPACSRHIPVNQECEIALEALHPMQPAVGMIQVEERAAKLKGETDFTPHTRRALPVVQAPDGNFHLTDGHHQASVLYKAGATRVKARVIGRFDNPANFWDEMRARRWVYLFDQKGKPITPAHLPRGVADLADDPYRSLAGYAQSAGYFGKTDTYFMEFEWARYFGARMGWQPVDRMTLLSALQSAARLACQPEARDLPGYLGPCPVGQ